MKKGDKFLCIKDYVYDNFEYIFIAGKIYICEESNRLPNEVGSNEPLWQNQKEFNETDFGKLKSESYWPQYFRQLHEEEDE